MIPLATAVDEWTRLDQNPSRSGPPFMGGLPIQVRSRGRGMHVVERGIDESLIVGDVIVRVIAIAKNGEVRVAISNPDGSPRYQEVILRPGDTIGQERRAGAAATMLEC